MDSTDVITPNGVFLPNFPLASGDVLRAIEHSGSVVPTYSNDAGECYAMAMAAVAPANEVKEGAIIVVPLTRPRDDEPLDFTFAAAAKIACMCSCIQLLNCAVRTGNVRHTVMNSLSGRSIALRGDSITALTWAITERPRGSIVSNASMVWTLLCVATDLDVNEVTHIAGKDNSNCDRLSRREQDEPNISVEQMAEDMGIGGTRVVELGSQNVVMNILRMCDPKILLTTESEFIFFWKKTRDAISDFLSLYPTSPAPSYHDESNADQESSNLAPSASTLPSPPSLLSRPSFSDYPQQSPGP
jgi:hypothetical protein